MQNKKSYCLLLTAVAVLLLVMSGCSTQKNTAAARAYHSMKTRYNIYFNGNVSFEEGEKAICDANKDDYSHILPLFPVSNHDAAKASVSQMDRAIEKSRKCIKLHSIKSKPKVNPKKRRDPEYKAWLTHEEFNESMDEAWIMLGKSEFHKGDFEGSIGTFRYIINHFGYDKDVVAQCQLWIVRAYAELGWLYEADDLLRKVSIEDLKRKHAVLYSEVAADLNMKQENYRDAIGFVKLALPEQKRDLYRPRFQYALAQLYEQTGDRQQAQAAYKKVVNLNPHWEMDFNARLRSAILMQNKDAALKELSKMAKRYKYKDKLDQIYGAIGDVYISKGDTVSAMENYAKAIELATMAGPEKAQVLITAGDLYYSLRQYSDAAPCYTEAAGIIDSEHKDYRRVTRLSETLGQLVTEYDVVLLQDSLQRLAKLPEEEQMKVVEKIIEEHKKQEQENKEKAEQAERENRNLPTLRSVDTQNMLGGGGGSAEWYFYNTQLMRSGQQQFRQKWGTRQLEDNWRRQSKNFTTAFETENTELTADSLSADSLTQAPAVVTDTHDPKYYLQQIPKTESELALSDSLIATALYNMIFIYQDRLEDEHSAWQTAAEFEQRFPNDSRLLDLYYAQYLRALKHNNKQQAEAMRNLIVARYPQTQQASIVADEHYFDKLSEMAHLQDSLFEQTYTDFRRQEYQRVKDNTALMEDQYPYSPLMPKFCFLNSIAVAKTEGQKPFADALRDLLHRYPDSDVAPMAKDMLAMMNEGLESQEKTDITTLSDMRSEMQLSEDTTLIDKSFSDERRTSHLVALIIDSDEAEVNSLLYEVALFNFSQFLIKDFDLKKEIPLRLKQVVDVLNQEEQRELAAVEVLGFESYDEALWYIGLLSKDAELSALLREKGAQILPISEENFSLLHQRYTLDEYREFEREHLEQ